MYTLMVGVFNTYSINNITVDIHTERSDYKKFIYLKISTVRCLITFICQK